MSDPQYRMSTEAALMCAASGLTYDEVMVACYPGRARRRYEVEVVPRIVIVYAELSYGRWIAIRTAVDRVSAMRWIHKVRVLSAAEVDQLNEEMR